MERRKFGFAPRRKDAIGFASHRRLLGVTWTEISDRFHPSPLRVTRMEIEDVVIVLRDIAIALRDVVIALRYVVIVLRDVVIVKPVVGSVLKSVSFDFFHSCALKL